MAGLRQTEQSALALYVSVLLERLGDTVETVWLFGSAARGDMWPAGSPMHSDIDILVVTSEPLPDSVVDELANLTYPLYLECGRQISPAFKSIDEWEGAVDDDLLRRVRSEGHQLWP